MTSYEEALKLAEDAGKMGRAVNAALDPKHPDFREDSDDVHYAAEFMAQHGEQVESHIKRLVAENERLRRTLNTPEIEDFARGVVVEAQHQRERWGEEHDSRKEQEDWFWTLGYLGGKILRALQAGDLDKAMHHCVSGAALLANWHARIKVKREPLAPEGEKTK